MKTVLFYGVFWILGVVLAFYIFRGLLFFFYAPPQEILDQFKNDQWIISIHKAGILITWCKIFLILSMLSHILFVLIGQKVKYAVLLISLLVASLSSAYFAFGTSFGGNYYQYSFIAVLVFGGISLVIPSSFLKHVGGRKKRNIIKNTFD